MNKSNDLETKPEKASHLQLFLLRLPKNNHDAIVQFAH
jgi:hypothetical protein